MQQFVKSFASGIASGAITYFVCIYTMGLTMAVAMPHGIPLIVWNATVVFGLGATLVALFVHLVSIRVFASKVLPALLGFAVTMVVALATTGELGLSYQGLAALFIGAALASAVHRRLGPNNSFKPKPLRGSA